MIIGIAYYIGMTQNGGSPFSEKEWQLITQRWETINTTWN